MTGEVQEQDKDSALANWECVRRTKRRGGLTGRTLEGEQVEATYVDRDGHVQHAAGMVRRKRRASRWSRAGPTVSARKPPSLAKRT
jgi:hypothetical protein